MILKNDYKILYEKITSEQRTGYATKNFPWDETSSEITLLTNNNEIHLSDYKLIYEKDNVIYGSINATPTENDDIIRAVDANNVTIFGNEPEIPYLCFVAEEANSTVSMTASANAPAVNLEYSLDKQTWQPFVVGTTVVTLDNIGDTVYLRGDNTTFATSEYKFNKFSITGSISAYGNIMSIFSKNASITSFNGEYACYKMFNGCISLTTAPELPATELSEWCYASMFNGCTSLITAPELPATELAKSCYNGMFLNCKSFTTAPELSATELATKCYYNMFNGCISLTTAPELPATGLAESCYEYMFNGCTSLITAPELPATELAKSCYGGMFQNCKSLTKVHELPATELAESCYNGMFSSCKSLTEAPKLSATELAKSCYYNMFFACTSLTKVHELPATELAESCYNGMFQGCASLTEISVKFTDFGNSTNIWLKNVSATGTFYCPEGLTISTRGNNTVPSGWEIVRI